MTFLTNDPLPQCLQTSSDIALSPPIGNKRGCGRYLLEVKCLGAQAIDQKMQVYAAGQDFMVDQDEWFKVQKGLPTGRSVMVDPIRRYMRDGRAFAAFTRQDELYQALTPVSYLWTCW